jgi:hypothetical protein
MTWRSVSDVRAKIRRVEIINDGELDAALAF